MTPLEFTLAAAALLAPGRDHTTLANAITTVAAEEQPLFQGDPDRRKTMALLVAVAFRESSLTTNAVGDHGHSFCAFQIHDSSGGGPALLADADACTRKGIAMLRASMTACAAHPLALYAAGPGGCRLPRAQRISRDRIELARRLYADVGASP